MKNLVLLLLISCFAANSHAQTVNIDTALKFNRSIYGSERHWIVKDKPDSVSGYTFGYVYVDGDEGIIFQKVGTFIIDQKNRYKLYPDNRNKPYQREALHVNQGMRGSVNLRFPPRYALLPPTHFKELKIKAEPDWVKPYYNYTDTLEHNYRWGCIYADEFWYYLAIPYLEKAYRINPHYKGIPLKRDAHDYWFSYRGVESQLAGVYMGSEQPDKGITILNEAILNNPKNPSFYVGLGLAYNGKHDWNKAIDAYQRGLSLYNADKSDQKAWFAGCISNMYGELKDDKDRIAWRAKADEYRVNNGTF